MCICVIRVGVRGVCVCVNACGMRHEYVVCEYSYVISSLYAYVLCIGMWNP